MSKKVTKKFIKGFNALDITGVNSEEAKTLRNKEKGFTTVAISCGIYGMTGAIIRGRNSKKLYKITARNSNLFYFVQANNIKKQKYN